MRALLGKRSSIHNNKMDTPGEGKESGRNEVFSFPEWQASSFSVDCTATRAVLAVQKWLAVVSLENPNESKALRKLARQNKYEIKTVLWHHHPAKRQLIVSTCQQKMELWDVSAERNPLLQSIKAHTRPVSDVSWSYGDPNSLSSCSTDTFIHVWDIREARKPKISFKAVAGATLVQCNRLNQNYIASAHDSDIRIWDKRKPSTASGYITAHMSRIHDLDWCYSNENHLTSCSHDGSIKFWDTLSPREPINSIKTGSQPLWRAKNYPVGNAVALLLVPTMHSGDSRVFLWGHKNISTPIDVFTGHSEAVLDLQWLNRDKLATWSKDRTLRLWAINEHLKLNLAGEEMATSGGDLLSGDSNSSLQSSGEQSMSVSLEDSVETIVPRNFVDKDPSMSLPIMRSPGVYGRSPGSGGGGGGGGSGSGGGKSSLEADSPSALSLTSLSHVDLHSTRFSPVFHSPGSLSLSQEFAQLKMDGIPNIEIEKTYLEASNRSCTVKVVHGGHLVRVGITFPSHYPNGAAPSFMFDKTTTINTASQQELTRNILDVATTYVKQSKSCLDPCLRCLAKSLEIIVNRPQPQKHSPDFDLFGRLDDEHIPFPRTSGARFSANGYLVCFNVPSGLVTADKNPRSLNKMNTYKSKIHPVARGPQRWTSHTYLSPAVSKRGSPGNSSMAGSVGRVTDLAHSSSDNPLTSHVMIYNAIPLLPIDPNLARVYSTSGSSIEEVCSNNAAAASQCGRRDLVQAWTTAALIAEMGLDPPPNPSVMPWSRHPFGRNLINSLFSHFGRRHDVQMLAMLACVFQQHYKLLIKNQKEHAHRPSPPPGPDRKKSLPHSNSTPSVSSALATPLPPVGAGSSGMSSSLRNGSSPPKKIQGQHLHPPPERDYLEYGGWENGVEEKEMKKSPISSSWHEVQLDNGEPLLTDLEDPVQEEQNDHEKQCRLLNSAMLRQCDEYHRSYANILYVWELLNQRAEILKFQLTSSPDLASQNTGFVILCRSCGDKVKGPSCARSHCYAFICSICNLSVKGSSNFCLCCGHGGHTKHMMEWFAKHSHCPSGCGCCCLETSGWS